MRIAMVAACPFPSLRGSQVLIYELARALSERGHKVHLVTYPSGESLTSIQGIYVHRVRAPRWMALGADLSWRKALLDLYLVLALHRVVHQERIDVIHAHNYEGPLIGFAVRWLTGVPVVYHSHNALSDELGYYVAPGWRRKVASWLGALLDRQVPRRADYSIALSPQLETFLRDRGVAAERLAVVPPAVAPSLFTDTPGSVEGLTGRFVVMYAGNLDPYQDLDVLIDGFLEARPRIGNALLVLVTHDAGWTKRVGGRLQALVRAGDARVVVAPAFLAVRRLMVAADVLVLPRSSWSGFPIKLINYMASGRPIIAAAGSAKGLVDGETGLIFPNRDVQALATAMERLFCDAALRQRLGANARVAARVTYSCTRAVDCIEAIYRMVCDRQGGKPRVTQSPTNPPLSLMGLPRGRLSAASGNRRE